MKKTWWRTAMDWFAVWMMLGLMLTCWIGQETRGRVLGYANLIFFFVLSALFFSQVDWIDELKKKDKELYLLIAGCVLAAINLFLARSNVGAIFTIVDFLLMLYLADKVILSRKMVGSLTVLCLALALYWLFRHPMFETAEFYPNGISHSSCTPLMFGLYGSCWLWEEKTKQRRRLWEILFFCASALMLWQTSNLLARGTMLGVLAAMCAYWILPKRSWSIYLVLAGTLLFPVGYVALWKTGILDAASLAGKPVMSGRDIIWATFMDVYVQHPIIGIGSDFERIVPDLWYKEVHHALLDLLFVHGGSVFLFVLYFLVKRLKELFNQNGCVRRGSRAALAISLLYGMMAIGTFENYYIVAPCSTVFFLILVLEHQKPGRNEEMIEREE